ncbi:hypothetical protein [Xanthocytophaga flava]|uniref:hypothetical protein n=1 Tax=Xanthocytophaga flava TaxID=3048013 RepID=UPI0028D00BC0|nr:hypothetical protein [Xanthocytophaga flavus]MDJ1468943.1 hypothetical protein [Xanthocytophaga flavus]
MKLCLYLATFISVLFVFSSCNQSEHSEEHQSVNQSTATATDSIELTALIRKTYEWYEKEGIAEDFTPMTKTTSDSIYSGIDWNAQNKRIKTLEQTGFFSNDFLKNYQNIASRIDQDLKQGKVEWLKDDMSPYSTDVNAWCNCQDNPDEYWKKLVITNLKHSSDQVSFQWTWGNDFYYKVQAKKENTVWKISYLEGLDFDHYIGTN